MVPPSALGSSFARRKPRDETKDEFAIFENRVPVAFARAAPGRRLTHNGCRAGGAGAAPVLSRCPMSCPDRGRPESSKNDTEGYRGARTASAPITRNLP